MKMREERVKKNFILFYNKKIEVDKTQPSPSQNILLKKWLTIKKLRRIFFNVFLLNIFLQALLCIYQTLKFTISTNLIFFTLFSVSLCKNLSKNT